MIANVPPAWADVLSPLLAAPAGLQLDGWLRAEEAAGKAIYPPRAAWLRALELTAPQAVKAVILGQDPYHGPGQAHGLAFSVPHGVKLPPSLRNIFRELHDDLGIAAPAHGNLEAWAREGVLLLNNTLTVEAGRAGSHAQAGWQAITDAVVAAVAERASPSVFILWGSHAASKAGRIAALKDGGRHCLIQTCHPSPLSAYRGFFGSKPFSAANAFLVRAGRGPVDWRP